MTVYIVSMYCPDDREDGTPILGVYSTRAQAEAHLADMEAEELEGTIEEWTVDAA